MIMTSAETASSSIWIPFENFIGRSHAVLQMIGINIGLLLGISRIVKFYFE